MKYQSFPFEACRSVQGCTCHSVCCIATLQAFVHRDCTGTNRISGAGRIAVKSFEGEDKDKKVNKMQTSFKVIVSELTLFEGRVQLVEPEVSLLSCIYCYYAVHSHIYHVDSYSLKVQIPCIYHLCKRMSLDWTSSMHSCTS